jgi:hypothetical protein
MAAEKTTDPTASTDCDNAVPFNDREVQVSWWMQGKVKPSHIHAPYIPASATDEQPTNDCRYASTPHCRKSTREGTQSKAANHPSRLGKHNVSYVTKQ